MSTKTPQQRYRLVSDNSGHEYIIKAGDEKLFDFWVNATENYEDTDLDFEDCRVNNGGWTFADPQGY